jgi:hypothetical protein
MLVTVKSHGKKTHNDEHPLIREHFGNMDMSDAEEDSTEEAISGRSRRRDR